MFSTLRTRFGIPGVISVMALVFAMLGGAYAANNASNGGKATASAKAKKGPRGPKGPKGDTGPAGPAGPQGPAGANGKDGANGSNGSNGTPGAPGAPGQSVTTTEILPLEECGEQSGVMLHSADGENEVCNGADGSPWTVGGTLPSGKTETGVWAGNVSPVGSGQAPISFPVPLAADIDEAHVRLNDFTTETLDPACDTFVNGTPVPVAGTPIPDPGYLCIYKASGSATVAGVNKVLFGSGASEVGALVGISGEEDQLAAGEWAVTAP